MLGPRVEEHFNETKTARLSDAKLNCPASNCSKLLSVRNFLEGNCCDAAKSLRKLFFSSKKYYKISSERRASIVDDHAAFIDAKNEENETFLKLEKHEKGLKKAQKDFDRAKKKLSKVKKEVNSVKKSLVLLRKSSEKKKKKLDEEAAHVVAEGCKLIFNPYGENDHLVDRFKFSINC